MLSFRIDIYVPEAPYSVSFGTACAYVSVLAIAKQLLTYGGIQRTGQSRARPPEPDLAGWGF